MIVTEISAASEPRGHIVDLKRTLTSLGVRLVITIRTTEFYRVEGVAYGLEAELLLEALRPEDLIEFRGYCHEGIWNLSEVALLRREGEP